MGNPAANRAVEGVRVLGWKPAAAVPGELRRRRGAVAWPQAVSFSGRSARRAYLLWAKVTPKVTPNVTPNVTDHQSEVPTPHPLEMLYREHEGLLRSIAQYRYRIPPCDAEALVHDIFASFLERQPEAYDMKAFLIGSINNACKHYWRKRQNEEPLLPHHELTPNDDEAAKLERWALRLSLGATLARLGGKCSETLRRYYLRDESAEAIALELDTSPAYVWQLLSSCRKRARQIYTAITRSGS
jgi:RNA polymerase sigma factor (sigma-70 family)